MEFAGRNINGSAPIRTIIRRQSVESSDKRASFRITYLGLLVLCPGHPTYETISQRVIRSSHKSTGRVENTTLRILGTTISLMTRGNNDLTDDTRQRKYPIKH